jgi:hypothetical protein
MSIVYPLALPTSIGVAEITLRARNVVALSESPFTFRQQVFKHPGERWEASITLPTQRRDLIEPWIGFLLALKGQTGTFLLGDPSAATPRGSLSQFSSTVVVNGAQSSGSSSINLKGFPNSQTNLLVAGDYIQLGSSGTATLHKVLLPVSSNSSGEATAEVWPAVRRSLTDNEPVVYTNTVGRFRLTEPVSEWTINSQNNFQSTFNAVEAV